MEKNDNSLMVWLNFPCCIFDEIESEEFQRFLTLVNAFAKPESDKSLPKLIADEYNEFEMYLMRIKIFKKEFVSHKKVFKICMKALYQKQNDYKTLKKKMDEKKVWEADLVKRIGDLEMKKNTLEENIHHIHAKINAL